MIRSYATYKEYWDVYLKAHSKLGTRACHYVATCVGLGFGLFGLVTLNWLAILVGVAGGYAIAFSSHFLIEHNRPLAHRPVWGAVSDLRMFGLALTGRLRPQLHSAEPYGPQDHDPRPV